MNKLALSAHCLFFVIPLSVMPLGGCSKTADRVNAATVADDTHPTEIRHEACDIDSPGAVKVDVNGNGKPDIIRVMSGERELCRAVDFGFRGRFDTFIYFDERGQIRRRESDFDADGTIDEVANYKDGQLVRKDRETNLDGKFDTWDFFVAGVLVRRDRDTNADGRVDQWWTFPDAAHPDCPIVATDADGDGRPDTNQDICKEREAAQSSSQSKPPEPASSTSAAPAAPPPSPHAAADAGGDA